jgi:hypothetical protein
MASFQEPNVQNRFLPDEFAERIESFKAELFWPDLTPPVEIEKILSICNSADSLKNLGAEDIAIYATVISSYAMYLTKEENRLQSYWNWCESNIKFIVGQKVEEAFGSFFQERDWYIRSHEQSAMKLGEVQLSAKVKLDSIRFIGQKLGHLSERLENLSYAKSRSR